MMRRSPFSLTRNMLDMPRVGFRWLVAWTTVLCLQISWFSWAKEELVEEQVTFSAGEIELEVLFATPAQPPTIGAVVCHPHPLYGGEMHNNVVSALVAAFQQQGIATLRFNFRGVGRSGGSHGEGVAELEDVKAAVTY